MSTTVYVARYSTARCNTSLLKQLHRRRLETRHHGYESRTRTDGWQYDHVPAKWSWSYWSSHSNSQSQRYQLVAGEWTNVETGSKRAMALKETMANPTAFSPVAMQSSIGGLFEEARQLSSDIMASMPKPGWIDPVRTALKEYPPKGFPKAVEWEHNEASFANLSEMVRRGYATVGVDRAAVDKHLEEMNPKDAYSKNPQGMQTSFANESVAALSEQILRDHNPPTAVDRHGYTNKPQGMQTQFEKEQPGTLEGELNAAQEPESQGQVDRHGYDYIPTGMQTSFESERGTPSGNVTWESKDAYSNVPQGLETSFAKDRSADFVVPDNLPSTEPIDNYSKKPQGLETSFEKEAASDFVVPDNLPQGQAAAPIEAHKYSTLDEYSKKPQGLETAFAKEGASEFVVPDNLPEASPADGYSTKPQGLETAFAKDTADFVVPDRPVSDFYRVLTLEGDQVVTGNLQYAPSAAAAALTPQEALPKLSSPLKFLPQIESLNAEGWGIMHADKDMLIFKKMPQVSSPTKDRSNPAGSPLKRVLAGGFVVGGLTYLLGVGAELVKG